MIDRTVLVALVLAIVAFVVGILALTIAITVGSEVDELQRRDQAVTDSRNVELSGRGDPGEARRAAAVSGIYGPGDGPDAGSGSSPWPGIPLTKLVVGQWGCTSLATGGQMTDTAAVGLLYKPTT